MPRRDAGAPRAVEVEGQRDLRLAGPPGDRDATTVAGGDLEAAECGRHAGGLRARRGSGLGWRLADDLAERRQQAVVLGRRPDREPQVVREGVLPPERPRHEPATQERRRRRRSARSREPNATSRKLVTDGSAGNPAAARPAARRPRSARTRSTFAARTSGRRRAAATSATDGMLTEPGGRYGSITPMTSGLAIAKPTRMPARA